MRKKKPQSYASLKKRLDAVFSVWTRMRFSDPQGIAPCASCGVLKPWKQLQCGHFQKRHYLATRWHPENCAPQCSSCNVFMGGNYASYAAWGVNRYGMDWPARMVSLSRVPTKFSRGDLTAMIEDYEKRLEQLAQT